MRNKRIIITGGAGFIGINASERFMNEGYDVIIFDNLSRENFDSSLNTTFSVAKRIKALKLNSWIKSIVSLIEESEFTFILGTIKFDKFFMVLWFSDFTQKY